MRYILSIAVGRIQSSGIFGQKAQIEVIFEKIIKEFIPPYEHFTY